LYNSYNKDITTKCSSAWNTNQLTLFAILIGAIVLLFTEWIRIDLVAILIILALSLTGVLTPDEALSGFSSEPAVMVASVS
jgi:hypothetical protein